MNITVINGTEKYGVTYRLKEMFLAEFRDKANITEYYLPKDCPNFCVGCDNATSTGAMKAFLDHFAYRWIPHRPAPEMFRKRAVIITQCLGSGAKSAAKDIKHSLSWWGISKIGIFTGALMSDIVWEKLSRKKQAELTGKIQKLSRKFDHIDYTKPAHTNLITKFKVFFCRMMQKSIHKSDPEYLDGKYWAEQGWLDSGRPWK